MSNEATFTDSREDRRRILANPSLPDRARDQALRDRTEYARVETEDTCLETTCIAPDLIRVTIETDHGNMHADLRADPARRLAFWLLDHTSPISDSEPVSYPSRVEAMAAGMYEGERRRSSRPDRMPSWNDLDMDRWERERFLQYAMDALDAMGDPQADRDA